MLAAQEGLKRAKTAAGDSIFIDRVTPLTPQKFACVSIGSSEEDSEEFNSSPLSYKNTAHVELVLQVTTSPGSDANEDYALKLRAVLAPFVHQVWTWLCSNETIPDDEGDTCDRLRKTGTSYIFQTGGEAPIGQATLKIDVTYYAEAPSIDMADLPPLAHVTLNINTGDQGPRTELPIALT